MDHPGEHRLSLRQTEGNVSWRPLGQAKGLLELLAGHSRQEVQALIEAGHLLKMMLGKDVDLSQVDVLSFKEGLRPFDPASAFTSHEKLASAFLERARVRRWPFTPRQLQEVVDKLPLHPSHGLSCYSFDIWLGDFERTYKELWLWMGDVLGVDVVHEWRGLFWGRDRMQLLPGVRRYVEGQPSLGVVRLDLGAHWPGGTTGRVFTSPASVRRSESSPGLELLAAAALHPKWYVRTGSRLVPGIWLPGLQIRARDDAPWTHVPLMRWVDAEHELFMGEALDSESRGPYSIPVIVERL